MMRDLTRSTAPEGPSRSVDVSVIISTYQRRDLTVHLLRSLDEQCFEGYFEVILIVDGSTDGTAPAARALAVGYPLRIVEQPNRGLARARNLGAALANGRILLFLDDDMEPVPELLAEHLRSYREGADVVLGPIPLHPDSPKNLIAHGVGAWARGLSERLAAPGWQPLYDDLIGGHISMLRDVFETAGGFDERFNLQGAYGAEDVELGHRLIESGCRIVFNERAIAAQKYVVTPETHLRQNRQVGHADVAIVRKHPDLHDRTFAHKIRTSEIHRVLWRPVLAFPRLSGLLTRPLRSAAIRRVAAGRRDRLTALLFFSARSLEYWRGVHEAGGIPKPRPVRILAYHSVSDLSGDPVLEPYGIPVTEFVRQLESLRRWGYCFLEPVEMVRLVEGSAGVPRKSVFITFDDCYQDLIDSALPVLDGLGIPCAAFAVTGRLGGTNDWDQSIGAHPVPLLDVGDLQRLDRMGIEVGGHSRSHRMLVRLSDPELDDEVGGSMNDLDALGLARLRLFAYPGGEHDSRVRRAADHAGVRLAFTVDPGLALPGQDCMRIPRTEILRQDTGARFRLKVSLAGREAHPLTRARRVVRRLRERLALL